MRQIFLFFLQGIFLFQVLSAQGDLPETFQTNSIRQLSGPPDVYLDCRRCDYYFIGTEIGFINYALSTTIAITYTFGSKYTNIVNIRF